MQVHNIAQLSKHLNELTKPTCSLSFSSSFLPTAEFFGKHRFETTNASNRGLAVLYLQAQASSSKESMFSMFSEKGK